MRTAHPFPSDSIRDKLWRLTSVHVTSEATAEELPLTHSVLADLIAGPEVNESERMGAILTRRLGPDFGKALRRRSLCYSPGMPLVPLKNPNGHNYTLGEPVIYGTHNGPRSAFKIDATENKIEVGNNLPNRGPDGKTVRLATAAELEALIKRLDDPTVEKLLLLISAATILTGDDLPCADISLRYPEALRRLGEVETASESRPSRRSSSRRRRTEDAVPVATPADDEPGL